MIRNRSWTLTSRQNFKKKALLKKCFWTSISGLKIYKPQVIIANYCNLTKERVIVDFSSYIKLSKFDGTRCRVQTFFIKDLWLFWILCGLTNFLLLNSFVNEKRNWILKNNNWILKKSSNESLRENINDVDLEFHSSLIFTTLMLRTLSYKMHHNTTMQ